jgi:hypothetical protein
VTTLGGSVRAKFPDLRVSGFWRADLPINPGREYERMHPLPLVPETLLEPDILLEPITVDEFYQHQYQVIVGED